MAALHGLSNVVRVYCLDGTESPRTIHVYGHPQALCWRDNDTVVVGENKQLSQFYCPVKGEVTQINHVNVSLNDVSCICSFISTGDVAVCTESDRGVFLLSSRDLRIVKRWRTAIRSSVLKCVSDAGSVLYMCGDDNEVLTLNTGGKEEKDSALKERHSLNVRSRSRVIGLCLGREEEREVLYVLGENGDLDAIVQPVEYFCERRKRKSGNSEQEEKRAMLDDCGVCCNAFVPYDSSHSSHCSDAAYPHWSCAKQTLFTESECLRVFRLMCSFEARIHVVWKATREHVPFDECDHEIGSISRFPSRRGKRRR